MNKRAKIAINLLVIFLAAFIILAGVFIYKFATYKTQMRQGDSIFVIAVSDNLDDGNEKILNFTETFTTDVEGKSFAEVLSSDHDHTYTIESGFLSAIDGIRLNRNEKYFALYSETNCKNANRNYCGYGVEDLYVNNSVLEIRVEKVNA